MTPFERKERILGQRLRDIGVRHFKAKEFLYLGGSHYDPNSRAYGLNRLMPDSQLGEVIQNAIVLDAAREELLGPVITLSIYRSPAYNRAIGGAANSFHRVSKAVDATPRDPSKIRQFQRILRRLRDEGFWSGGLGIYSGFAHIDHGTVRNRDW